MASKGAPSIIALAGPNGAGKSTAGPTLVRKTLGVVKYVDADLLARGISKSDPASVAISAGRVMLDHLRSLASKKVSFAFETTLASRSFSVWIADLLKDGWKFDLVFLWLPSADLAVARVEDRVRFGGHGVPEEIIRRRYKSGLLNFFKLYRPLATSWRMYDNSGNEPRLIASGSGKAVRALDPPIWDRIKAEFGDA